MDRPLVCGRGFCSQYPIGSFWGFCLLAKLWLIEGQNSQRPFCGIKVILGGRTLLFRSPTFKEQGNTVWVSHWFSSIMIFSTTTIILMMTAFISKSLSSWGEGAHCSETWPRAAKIGAARAPKQGKIGAAKKATKQAKISAAKKAPEQRNLNFPHSNQ